MLEKRGDVEDPGSPRAGHIEHAKAALASGDLLIAGALADPVDEALFIWKGNAKTAAEDFGASFLPNQPGLHCHPHAQACVKSCTGDDVLRAALPPCAAAYAALAANMINDAMLVPQRGQIRTLQGIWCRRGRCEHGVW